MPKYQFNYFLKRCHALGTHKILGVIVFRCRLICREWGGYTRSKRVGLTLLLFPKKKEILCRLCKIFMIWGTESSKTEPMIVRMMKTSDSWCSRCKNSKLRIGLRRANKLMKKTKRFPMSLKAMTKITTILIDTKFLYSSLIEANHVMYWESLSTYRFWFSKGSIWAWPCQTYSDFRIFPVYCTESKVTTLS